MESKIAYIARIRSAAYQAARGEHDERTGQVLQGVALVAEQYASITEAEGMRRDHFDNEVFQRAYDAASGGDPGPSWDPTFMPNIARQALRTVFNDL